MVEKLQLGLNLCRLTFTQEKRSSTSETHLFGDTGGIAAAAEGLAGDVAFKDRVDRIEEAGLSLTDWSEEQNPSPGHHAAVYVVFNFWHVLHLLPAETSLMPIKV